MLNYILYDILCCFIVIFIWENNCEFLIKEKKFKFIVC